MSSEGETMGLTIDKEFRDFLPSMTADENLGLVEHIKAEGCRDPLVAWKFNGQRILVDGYSRYEICKRHDIKFNIVDLEFIDRQAVKQWMWDNQGARRNWSAAVRIEVALKLKPEMVEKAAENKGGRPSQKPKLPVPTVSEDQPQDHPKQEDKEKAKPVRDQIAELADVAPRQVDKMEDVLEFATPKLKDAVRADKVPIAVGAAIATACVEEVQNALADERIEVSDAKQLGQRPKSQQVARMERMLAIRAKQAAEPPKPKAVHKSKSKADSPRSADLESILKAALTLTNKLREQQVIDDRARPSKQRILQIVRSGRPQGGEPGVVIKGLEILSQCLAMLADEAEEEWKEKA